MALVGWIARAHGIRGQVIVNPETDFPDERFRPGAELFIERGGRVETMTVTTARFHRDRPVTGLARIETTTDAEAPAGRQLRVPLERLAVLPQHTFCRHPPAAPPVAPPRSPPSSLFPPRRSAITWT